MPEIKSGPDEMRETIHYCAQALQSSRRSRLPILHATRQDWRFTALYSNTARAHELDRVRDWVVIGFHDDVTTKGSIRSSPKPESRQSAGAW